MHPPPPLLASLLSWLLSSLSSLFSSLLSLSLSLFPSALTERACIVCGTGPTATWWELGSNPHRRQLPAWRAADIEGFARCPRLRRSLERRPETRCWQRPCGGSCAHAVADGALRFDLTSYILHRTGEQDPRQRRRAGGSNPETPH